MRTTIQLAVLFSLVLVSACDTTRERLMNERYPAYPETIKRAIDRGFLINGMDHDQVFLTLGEPVCKKTIQHNGRPVEVWLYPPSGKNPCTTAEFRVYFEAGGVTGWQAVKVPSEGG
ncbi:MAG: hypothetical protein AB1555_15195 [Nitrospirota bacterium]